MLQRKSIWLIFIILLQGPSAIYSQVLKPGFDKEEYLELMRISSRFGDSIYQVKIHPPQSSKHMYRSPVTGLDNCWDLWQQDRGVAVISIRGTTENETSWLANFYSAMVPAKGSLQLSANETWNYELANQPDAAVHTGWLICMAFLSKDILPKIDSAARAGTSEFIILGHSQGGAIAYLFTSYLHNLQQKDRLPSNLRFKTYCSAAPKPGNLYYAYEYEDQTKNGWGLNVVNSADWVPETPFSIQTMEDINPVNPFADHSTLFKNVKFPGNLAIKYAFARMNNPSKRARKNYQKFLGNFVSKSISRRLKGFKVPEYFNSFDYVRTGQQVVLLAGEDYFEKFPQRKEKVFGNHLHQQYIFLAEKYGNETKTPAKEWILKSFNWMNNSSEVFSQMPRILLNVSKGLISGNSGCNSFSASPIINGNTINFNVPVMSTKKYCQGNAEMIFFQALQAVNRFELNSNQLIFFKDGAELMRFGKQ